MRAELGQSWASALQRRTKNIRQALSAHWRLTQHLGGHSAIFKEGIAAARLVGVSEHMLKHYQDLSDAANWSKHAPPPDALRLRGDPPHCVLAEQLEDFRATWARHSFIEAVGFGSADERFQAAVMEAEAMEQYEQYSHKEAAGFGSAEGRFLAAVDEAVATELTAKQGVTTTRRPRIGTVHCMHTLTRVWVDECRPKARRSRLQAARSIHQSLARRAAWSQRAERLFASTQPGLEMDGLVDQAMQASGPRVGLILDMIYQAEHDNQHLYTSWPKIWLGRMIGIAECGRRYHWSEEVEWCESYHMRWMSPTTSR